jgi:hypothetical protein
VNFISCYSFVNDDFAKFWFATFEALPRRWAENRQATARHGLDSPASTVIVRAFAEGNVERPRPD